MKRKNLLPVIIALIFILILCVNNSKKEARTFNPEKYEYHDGVAWVQLEERRFLSTEYLGVVCIDENGVEIFSMPEINNNEVSNYYNGIALVKGQYIIDKQGCFIHDLVEELDINGAKMFSNRYFDGYIFVNRIVNGVPMTGIVNSNLEWIIQPTSKLNNIEPKDNFLYYNSTVGYYDALTNEFIDADTYELRHVDRCFPESGYIFLLKEGYNTFKYSKGNTSGTIQLDENCQTGFYNKKLQMILDLGYYPSIEPLTDFRDGKCLVRFSTATNAKYVGLINLDGEFVFFDSDYIGYNTDKIEFNSGYFDWNGNYYVKDEEPNDVDLLRSIRRILYKT